MLYFILWVLLILAVIIAIPVVNWLENKRRRELAGGPEAEESVDEAAPDEEQPEGVEEVEEVEEEPMEVPGGGDFSAFDEEFK